MLGKDPQGRRRTTDIPSLQTLMAEASCLLDRLSPEGDPASPRSRSVGFTNNRVVTIRDTARRRATPRDRDGSPLETALWIPALFGTPPFPVNQRGTAGEPPVGDLADALVAVVSQEYAFTKAESAAPLPSLGFP
jgi:hypothetical protein